VFGRYKGVVGQIGFDGHWKSPQSGFHLVVEVKTSESWSIKTATLAGYINELISGQHIPDSDHAMGLYVIGRPDPDLPQLYNSIVAEKKTEQFRIISTDSLLSLAAMMSGFDIDHTDILALLKPPGPQIDPLIELIGRLVAQQGEKDEEEGEKVEKQEERPEPSPKGTGELIGKQATSYWLTPVKSSDDESAEQCVQKLVADVGVYAFGDKTPNRTKIKSGDWICFYAAGTGVVAHARVATVPKNEPHEVIHDSERYPWTFRVDSAVLYLDDPVVVDSSVRAHLERFKDRDPNKAWSWFVQTTIRLTEHDFMLLTKQAE
jgi:hypothetical protein